MKLYALTKGTHIYTDTISTRKADVWCGDYWGHSGFDIVSREQGSAWRSKYWRRLGPSKASATRLGYKVREVKVSLA